LRITLKVIVAAFFITLFVSRAAASTDAEAVVGAMLDRIDRLSAQSQLPDNELARRFRAIAREYLDRSDMARVALGREALRLDAAEWKTYAAAFNTHIEIGFVRGVREIGASTSRVLGERTTPEGKTVVITRINSGSRSRDTVFYMCGRAPGRICDIEVEGVRASARKRSDFLRVLSEEGFDALIAALKSGRLVEVQ
jgi:ABC-type transporter MlaC component